MDAPVAPVGMAWEKALTHRPDLSLWRADHVHATPQGTYLAACVLYAVIYGQSPVGLDYGAELPADTVQFLQSIAGETVPTR